MATVARQNEVTLSNKRALAIAEAGRAASPLASCMALLLALWNTPKHVCPPSFAEWNLHGSASPFRKSHAIVCLLVRSAQMAITQESESHLGMEHLTGWSIITTSCLALAVSSKGRRKRARVAKGDAFLLHGGVPYLGSLHAPASVAVQRFLYGCTVASLASEDYQP